MATPPWNCVKILTWLIPYHSCPPPGRKLSMSQSLVSYMNTGSTWRQDATAECCFLRNLWAGDWFQFLPFPPWLCILGPRGPCPWWARTSQKLGKDSKETAVTVRHKPARINPAFPIHSCSPVLVLSHPQIRKWKFKKVDFYFLFICWVLQESTKPLTIM